MARILLGLLTLAVLASPTSALASEHLGDRDVDFLSLKVNGRGEALVSYRKADGARRDVLIWGAVNAHAPDADRPQVSFRYDYSGGWKSHGTAQYARSFKDTCRRYDGPPLILRVAACKAPDGSYWAVQSWRRLAPMRGFAPFRPEQDAFELHVSHWSGPLPMLEVSPNWTYGGTLQGLFGRLTYRDEAVHGFRTPSATRRDPYARFVYIDTFNSVVRPGLEARHRHRHASAKRGLLLQLRRAGAAAGLPVERAARPRQRRAAPGDGHGPGRDADRAVGGRGPGPLQRCVGPGVQPALRPAGRAERQGLRSRALAAIVEPLEPFRLLADDVDPVHTRPARPFARELDQPLDGVPLALEHRLDGPVGQVPCPPADTGRLRAAARRLAKEDALNVTLHDDAAALHAHLG